ncbi:hypothetical protein YC2023_046099 [Brassica napus]
MLFSPIWDIIGTTQDIVLKSNPSIPLHVGSVKPLIPHNSSRNYHSELKINSESCTTLYT